MSRRRIVLKHAVLEYEPWGCVTYFTDGTTVPSVPHQTGHYFVIAHRCGYGDDVMAYCREHEFAHLFVAEKLGDTASQVLWDLAHGRVTDTYEAIQEETLAQSFQKWLRANERPILSGADWDYLKRVALELLDG